MKDHGLVISINSHSFQQLNFFLQFILKSPPGRLLRQLVESYLRTANNDIPIHVFSCDAWKDTAGKTPEEVQQLDFVYFSCHKQTVCLIY